MKLIIHLIVFSLLVSTTFAHLPCFIWPGRNCVNAELKVKCEEKIRFLSDKISFFSTIKSPMIPFLGFGRLTGLAATLLVEKTNWFFTSGLFGQVCNKFDDGAEHTIEELDYIEFGETRLKINDVMEDLERFKSSLSQQEQEVNAKVEAELAQIKAELAQTEAKLAQTEAKLVQFEAKLSQFEAKFEAQFAQIQTPSDKPHMVKTPEFLENSQFTKFSVQSDGEKSLETQPKIILKSSQSDPRVIRLQKRPIRRQRLLARFGPQPNMEQFREMRIGRLSRSVPRKSSKIFPKPPQFPRKKPLPRLLKGKTSDQGIHNIRGVELFVENDQVAPEPEFLPLHLNNDNVMNV